MWKLVFDPGGIMPVNQSSETKWQDQDIRKLMEMIMKNEPTRSLEVMAQNLCLMEIYSPWIFADEEHFLISICLVYPSFKL